ncbi:hypothetical protein BDR07DRAFT_1295775, partial [Suillus spraguei]
LFSFETVDGSWSPMTKPWFMDRINTIWSAVGHPIMPGHAFRIGGATELLSEGVHPDIVATQDRWKSRAFLDYWHQIESVFLYLLLLLHLPIVPAPSSSSSLCTLLDL